VPSAELPEKGCIDKSWKSCPDESAGWQTPGFDDSSWPAVKEIA